MPGYEGTLSDEAIVAVLSYIKSTWPAAIRARHDRMNEAARLDRRAASRPAPRRASVPLEPPVDFALGVLAGLAVTLLDWAFEPFLLAGHAVKGVVGKLCPI